MDAYAMYKMCVQYQVIQLDLGKTSSIRVYPVGYAHLPFAGSMMDQPHRLMEYFEHFMSGERRQFFEN